MKKMKGATTSPVQFRRIRLGHTMSHEDDVIERRAGEIYLKSADGWRYHVYDVAIFGGRIRRVPYESEHTTHRVFVTANQSQRHYAFGRGERFKITGPALERRLAAAVYQMGSNKHGHVDPR